MPVPTYSQSATLTWSLSGAINSNTSPPATGFSEREVSIHFDGEYKAQTASVATATDQLIANVSDFVGANPAALVVVIPEAAGTLLWYSDDAADSSTVCLRANWPFFIAGSNTGVYDVDPYIRVAEAPISTGSNTQFYFRQTSGSTVKVHVYILGSA